MEELQRKAVSSETLGGGKSESFIETVSTGKRRDFSLGTGKGGRDWGSGGSMGEVPSEFISQFKGVGGVGSGSWGRG